MPDISTPMENIESILKVPEQNVFIVSNLKSYNPMGYLSGLDLDDYLIPYLYKLADQKITNYIVPCSNYFEIRSALAVYEMRTKYPKTKLIVLNQNPNVNHPSFHRVKGIADEFYTMTGSKEDLVDFIAPYIKAVIGYIGQEGKWYYNKLIYSKNIDFLDFLSIMRNIVSNLNPCTM